MMSAPRRLFLTALLVTLTSAGLVSCDEDSDTGGSIVDCGAGEASDVLITTAPAPCTAITPIRPAIKCTVCNWTLQNDSDVVLTTTALSNEPDTIVVPANGAASPGAATTLNVDVDCSTSGTVEVGTFEVTVRDGTGVYVCSTGFTYDVTVGTP